MARRIFGRTDVVGQTFKQDFKESKVVGVVREGSYLLPASYGQIYMPYSCLPGYDKNNDGSHKVGTYVVYFKVRQKEDMPKLYAEVNELVRKYNTSQKEYTVDIFHQYCSFYNLSPFRLLYSMCHSRTVNSPTR